MLHTWTLSLSPTHIPAIFLPFRNKPALTGFSPSVKSQGTSGHAPQWVTEAFSFKRWFTPHWGILPHHTQPIGEGPLQGLRDIMGQYNPLLHHQVWPQDPDPSTAVCHLGDVKNKFFLDILMTFCSFQHLFSSIITHFKGYNVNVFCSLSLNSSTFILPCWTCSFTLLSMQLYLCIIHLLLEQARLTKNYPVALPRTFWRDFKINK